VAGASQSPVLEYFLVRCETVGCADFAPAGGGGGGRDVWTQRFGARLQLGCVTSSVTWQLFCVDGSWQGPSTNCTSSGNSSLCAPLLNRTIACLKKFTVSGGGAITRRSKVKCTVHAQCGVLVRCLSPFPYIDLEPAAWMNH